MKNTLSQLQSRTSPRSTGDLCIWADFWISADRHWANGPSTSGGNATVIMWSKVNRWNGREEGEKKKKRKAQDARCFGYNGQSPEGWCHDAAAREQGGQRMKNLFINWNVPTRKVSANSESEPYPSVSRLMKMIGVAVVMLWIELRTQWVKIPSACSRRHGKWPRACDSDIEDCVYIPVVRIPRLCVTWPCMPSMAKIRGEEMEPWKLTVVYITKLSCAVKSPAGQAPQVSNSCLISTV